MVPQIHFHQIIDSFRLKKAFKIVKFNHQLESQHWAMSLNVMPTHHLLTPPGWGLHHLLAQPVPMPNQHVYEEIFPDI